jgi:hypothetical protein
LPEKGYGTGVVSAAPDQVKSRITLVLPAES